MLESDFDALAPGQLVPTTVIQRRPSERGFDQETIAGVAFLPDPLPPKNLSGDQIKARFYEQMMFAERSLSELEGAARRLPNPHLLIGPLLMREAILSSKIENTIASADQLVLFEEDPSLLGERQSTVQEVHNYIRAVEFALRDQRPLSLNLLKDCHHILLDGVRGNDNRPGEFRDRQNWIGRGDARFRDARFVPPPPNDVPNTMSDLENFIHQTDDIPRLVRFAFIHYQFETIHPFFDGNGRLGRLMITLLLCHKAQLTHPLLHISGYFERFRTEYYDRLLEVSTHGAWNEWIEFFLVAVANQSQDSLRRADALVDLQKEFHARVQDKRAPANLHRLIDELFNRPRLTVKDAGRITGVTPASAGQLVQKLVEKNIIREATGRQRDRIFVSPEIIDIINREFD